MNKIFMATPETVMDILSRSKKHYIVMRDIEDSHVWSITFYEVNKDYGKLLTTWFFTEGNIVQIGFSTVDGEEALLEEYFKLLDGYEQGYYRRIPELY